MITSIAFDLGGVLFAEGKVTALNTFKEHGYDAGKVWEKDWKRREEKK